MFLTGVEMLFRDQMHNLPSSETVTILLEFLVPIWIMFVMGVLWASREGIDFLTGSFFALKSYIYKEPFSHPEKMSSDWKFEKMADWILVLDLKKYSGLAVKS